MNNPQLADIFLKVAGIEGLSGKEKNVASFVKSFLNELNLYVTEDGSSQKTGSNTGNIICKFGNGSDMLLSCHMDTARSTGHLVPVIKSDRITSDGNSVLGVDNRVGVTLLLALAEKIVIERIAHKDFTLAFVTCEETTLAGSENLEIDNNIKKAIVFDSYMRPGKYIAASVGAAGYKIKVLGKAAHSGIDPEKGINALQIAVQAVNKINLGRINDSTTSNIGIINGGTATNVIPDLIEMSGEVRSKNTDEVQKHVEEIKCVFEQTAIAGNGKVEFEWSWDFMPFCLATNSEVIRDVENAIYRAYLKPERVLSYGGSDANSYNGRGIEAVNIGIGAQNPHSNEEFILLEDLDNAFQIALELIKK